MDKTSKPRRAELLETAISYTVGDRDVEYVEPKVNLACATRLKDAFWHSHTRDIGKAEREAIDMILTKLSRLACGNRVKADTYIDIAVYACIAGECAEQEQGLQMRVSEEGYEAGEKEYHYGGFPPQEQGSVQKLNETSNEPPEDQFDIAKLDTYNDAAINLRIKGIEAALPFASIGYQTNLKAERDMLKRALHMRAEAMKERLVPRQLPQISE